MFQVSKLLTSSQRSAAVAERVEGRPVSERLEGLALQFDRGADFLEVARDAHGAVHGDQQAQHALEDDVQRQHREVLLSEPQVGPVLGRRYCGVHQSHNAERGHQLGRLRRHAFDAWVYGRMEPARSLKLVGVLWLRCFAAATA
ncbi:hypothetical protein MRX96_045427 [Rhipicephalus microplus]